MAELELISLRYKYGNRWEFVSSLLGGERHGAGVFMFNRTVASCLADVWCYFSATCKYLSTVEWEWCWVPQRADYSYYSWEITDERSHFGFLFLRWSLQQLLGPYSSSAVSGVATAECVLHSWHSGSDGGNGRWLWALRLLQLRWAWAPDFLQNSSRFSTNSFNGTVVMVFGNIISLLVLRDSVLQYFLISSCFCIPLKTFANNWLHSLNSLSEYLACFVFS